jgi:inosose dehydratase
MTIQIGNAPCSWGVEFANDPRNPAWRTVLKDARRRATPASSWAPSASCPRTLRPAEALDEHGLELIGGVVFRAFHDPDQWDDVLDGAVRTCKALTAHGAQHLVLIDSISPRRAPTAGRADARPSRWTRPNGPLSRPHRHRGEDGRGRVRPDRRHSRPCRGLHGFRTGTRAPAGRGRREILKICFDTGHHSYAGFDPVAFMKRHISRISYMHFKDIDPVVKADVIANRTGFYDACGQGIFCNLGQGDVDFPAVRQILLDGFRGLVHGGAGLRSDARPRPLGDATANRAYLKSIGF